MKLEELESQLVEWMMERLPVGKALPPAGTTEDMARAMQHGLTLGLWVDQPAPNRCTMMLAYPKPATALLPWFKGGSNAG